MISKIKQFLLRKLLGHRPLYEKVMEIEDDKSIYVWITDQDTGNVHSTIENAYKEKNGEKPQQSIHIITRNIEDVSKLNYEKLKKYFEG